MKPTERDFLRTTAQIWLRDIGAPTENCITVHDNGDFTAYYTTYDLMDEAWSSIHMGKGIVKRVSFKGKKYQYVRFALEAQETTDVSK